MSPRSRRSSGRRFSSSQRRKLVWASVNEVLNFTAVGNVSNVDMLSDLKVPGASILGATIMRTHVHLAVTSTVAAGNDFLWGLIVGQNANVVTNTPDTPLIPDGGDNPELDWMYLSHEVAAPTYSQNASNNHIILDNKAKRRIQELNQTYLLSLGVNSGGATMSFQLFARTLLALP